MVVSVAVGRSIAPRAVTAVRHPAALGRVEAMQVKTVNIDAWIHPTSLLRVNSGVDKTVGSPTR